MWIFVVVIIIVSPFEKKGCGQQGAIDAHAENMRSQCNVHRGAMLEKFFSFVLK